MKDVALAGAPLDEPSPAVDRAAPRPGKMKGYRGKPALHEPSAVKALVACQSDGGWGSRIASIDVNPFLINARTGVAVDALIVLK